MKDYKTKTKEDFKDSLVFQRDLAEMLGQEVKSLQARVKEAEHAMELHRENYLTLAAQSAKVAAENARLRKVVDAAREVEKIYWNFDRSMRPQIEDLKGALHKLDGENKCDCHNHERQVCDICQGVGGKDK